MAQEQVNKKDSGAESFLKKVMGFSLSSYIGAVITFGATFVNTRIFDTAVLGQINLFITVQNFLIYFLCLGLDQSYCRYYYEYQTRAEKTLLFRKCLEISLWVAVLVGGGVLIAWDPVSRYIGGEASFVVAVALVVSAGAHVVCRYLSLLQRMKQKVLGYTILTVGMSVAHKLSYSATSMLSRDYITSIVAIVVSYVVWMLIFAWTERADFRLPREERPDDKHMVRKVLWFGLPLMPISLLSWLNSSIPTLLMREMLSYESIGIYSNAVVITSAISLIQNGFNTFWVPYYYENYKGGNDRIKKVHNIISFGMVAFAIGMILFKDVLFWIVGEEYKSGAAVFALLLVSPVCYTIGETTGIGISISEKSYLHSIAYVSGIVTNLGLCIVLIPALGMVGAGVAVAMAAMVSLVVKTIIGERYYRSISSYGKSVSALGCLLAAAVWDSLLSGKNFLAWACGLLVLLAALVILYRREVKYCVAVGKRIIRRKKP